MSMSHETDEALMQHYQEGHALAFDLLFERHRQKVWAFLLKRLSNRENAEEVFQMTWIKFHESRFRYDSDFPLLPWIFLIARQNLIDWVRRSKKHRSEFQSEEILKTLAAPESTSPPSIEAFLSEMTSDERALYESHFIDDQTFDEIAKKTQQPSATLRKRFSRMILRLRKGELTS
jgi:RNA polymerase sigma factor (sigma-70 family)